MTLKITPGRIESDGHVVLLPPGLTGTVEVGDGTTYDLGPAAQEVIEVSSPEHAAEVAMEASRMALADESVTAVQEFDEAQSRKNLGLKKGS